MSTATMMPQAVVPTTEIVGTDALAPMTPQIELPLYRLSVEQYNAMVKVKILDERSRVHLIHGLLVSKMAKHQPHATAFNNCAKILIKIVPDDWHVSLDNPVELVGSSSVPEPDFAILRGITSDYDERPPGSGDIGLLIEISDSSLRMDRTLMKATYASACIAVYWIINLVEARIEVYTEPIGPSPAPDYAKREDFGPGDFIPLILDDVEIARLAVADFLPPSVLRRVDEANFR